MITGWTAWTAVNRMKNHRIGEPGMRNHRSDLERLERRKQYFDDLPLSDLPDVISSCIVVICVLASIWAMLNGVSVWLVAFIFLVSLPFCFLLGLFLACAVSAFSVGVLAIVIYVKRQGKRHE